MTIEDMYKEGEEFPSLLLLIEYLVHERKVLRMTDEAEKLNHYLQPKFRAKMNEYLDEYRRKKDEGI